MPEQTSIYSQPDHSEYDFLTRVYLGTPGESPMGSGGIVVDPGNDNRYYTTDDEYFVLTAMHVAGNDLFYGGDGRIQMYLNEQWQTVDTFTEDDVFLVDNKLGESPENDLALIRTDLDLNAFEIDPKNLIKIPDSPVQSALELNAYGATENRSEALKVSFSDYVVNDQSIIIDEAAFTNGDSGGPLIKKVNGNNLAVGLISESTGLLNEIGMEYFKLNAFVNLDQEDIDFIKDVFENEQDSKHFDIKDVDKTFVDTQMEAALLSLLGVSLVGGLSIYAIAELIGNIQDKNKLKPQKSSNTNSSYYYDYY